MQIQTFRGILIKTYSKPIHQSHTRGYMLDCSFVNSLHSLGAMPLISLPRFFYLIAKENKNKLNTMQNKTKTSMPHLSQMKVFQKINIFTCFLVPCSVENFNFHVPFGLFHYAKFHKNPQNVSEVIRIHHFQDASFFHMDVLAPIIVQNFKKLLRANPKLRGYTILGPK